MKLPLPMILFSMTLPLLVISCSGNEQQTQHNSAVERLASAPSTGALRTAVGERGRLYVYLDKSWIAVWYERWEYEHPTPGQDQYRAVVLDSAGEWFQSSRPFGSAFVQLPRRNRRLDRYLDDRRKGLRAHDQTAAIELRGAQAEYAYQDLMARLTVGPDVAAARAALAALGFSEFSPHLARPLPKIAVADTDITVPKPLPPAEQKAEDDLEYQFGGSFTHEGGITAFLSSPDFNDKGMAALKTCPEIEVATFQWYKVTDRGLWHLRELPHLRELHLMLVPLGDSGLAELGNVTTLTTLSINEAAITDVGIVHLDGLKNLATLNLLGAPLNDASLASLEKLPALRDLNICGTRMTEGAIEKFRQHHPNVNVHSDARW